MSTAGKVLVALVTVLLVGWLVMLSMVAQLNSNWGKVIADQTGKIETLRKDVETSRAELAEVKTKLSREQVAREHDVVVLRTEVADRERALTDTIEALERVTNQVEGQSVSLRLAEVGRTRRQDEKVQSETDLTETRQEVAGLIERNEEMMGRLAQLREEFKDLLQENRRLVGRKAGARSAE